MLVSIIRKGQNFQRRQKTGKNLNKHINILFVPCNTETIRVAYRSKYTHKRKKQVNDY